MLLYYITDHRSFAGTESQQWVALLARIAAASRAGVDYIQLREKDVSVRELEKLAREAVRAVRDNSLTTKLLVNARTDVALAVDADGVQLQSGELPASEVRTLWLRARRREPVIGVSAHSVEDVRYAETHGASFAVLAPIFEKHSTGARGIGLDILQTACRSSAPPDNTESAPLSRFRVLALGGVTVANALNCLHAGAAGVAGIRLFQEGDVAETIRRLRELLR